LADGTKQLRKIEIRRHGYFVTYIGRAALRNLSHAIGRAELSLIILFLYIPTQKS
jgi:hypothetical protein